MSYILDMLHIFLMIILIPLCVVTLQFAHDVLEDDSCGGKLAVISTISVTTALVIFTIFYMINGMNAFKETSIQRDYTAITLSYITPKVEKEEPIPEEINKLKSRILIEEYYE